MTDRIYFDIDYFKEIFPYIDISGMTPFYLSNLWDIAVMIVGDRNSNSFAPYNPSQEIYDRRKLLYLALAHIIQTQKMQQSTNGSGLSGRITSASEGSVNISIEAYKADSLTAQWWSQTEEGRIYWMLTAKYRLGGHLYMHREAHPWG